MEFAERLPKTNSSEECGELIFCSFLQGVKDCLIQYPAGQVLLVTDQEAVSSCIFAAPRRLIRMVLDTKNCLPLFSASDDVSLILAAGGRNILRAARFFAEVRKIPCVLFPTCAALDGTSEEAGEICLQESCHPVPLAEGRIICDTSLMKESLGAAYMRLVLSRLALLESRALRKFGVLKEESAKAEERAFLALFSLAEGLSAEEIVKKNYVLRKCERAGMREGEGATLARLIGRNGEAQAYLILSALYSAFFCCGKPRFHVPDYAARARRAGISYAQLQIPTPEEFARRALALEEMRSEMNGELDVIVREESAYRRNFYRLTDRTFPERLACDHLQTLPERVLGLSGVIRDFGLLEGAEKVFSKSN